ncbi:MAG: pilus assembly FimT family protein [Planctomycetota bacterium]
MWHDTHNTQHTIRRTRYGFTLTELVMVVLMISLFVLMAQINLFGLLRKSTFKAQVQDFVSTMQMAVSTAAESNRRYEVIIDLTEQSYMLRQITSTDIYADVLEEEIIVEKNFADNCWVEYVLFDDYDINDEKDSFTNAGRAKFRAGHSGWQYGGVIVLLDEDDRAYTVAVNRINRTVMLKEGEIEPLLPKSQSEIPF